MNQDYWTRKTLSRRSILRGAAALSAGALATTLIGCGSDDEDEPAASSQPASSGNSGRAVDISFQTGWFAQVESAAVLSAVVYNTLPENIKVTVRDGGPGSTPINSVAVGQLDMASVSADNLMFARDQGINLKVFMSTIAMPPLGLFPHKEMGIKTWEDMKGKKIAVSNGTIFWEFLKKKYGYSDSDKSTYNGTMAVWLQDKNLITQAFATNEPYQMEQAGAAYDTFLLDKAGYNSPLSMIAASESFLEKNRDIMPAFQKAIREGVAKSFADPAPLYAELKKRNPTQTEGNVLYSWKAMMSFVNNPYTLEKGYAAIDPAQMSGLHAAISDLGLFKTKFKPEDLYTNEFNDGTILKTPAV